ncbi:heparinase II/III family protein [Clostridium sp. 19966]|uniref:heparinase II/III domain-containing protein n=1 Tax=Clostridium sp. 19966 TaxID=2768166 RepID=UPI0028E09F28|nr:heparinase II/III family protein [Clostridium sp. 19966]MDT8717548.1 heparinase II/III family protein [Clostridium sp. 19966]
MNTLSEIKEALIYGIDNNYVVFPEARNKEIIKCIKANNQNRQQLLHIKENAEKALKEPSPTISFKIFKEFESTGKRLIFEDAYFGRRKQLFSLVLAYMFEDKPEYKEAIEEKLWEWCDLYSWELPAHFSMRSEESMEGDLLPDKTIALFAAESAFFFAEIISLTGEELDEFLILRLKKEIFRRVIEPFMRNSYWWEGAKMNWASVCAGSVGAAAIYLVEDIEELSAIIQRVLKSMEAYLGSFDKDGVTGEGLSYWSYGFGFYSIFAQILKERTCSKLSLLTGDKKIKNIAALPQVLQFPSGYFVNFSDAAYEKWKGDCGLFARLEKELNLTGYNYENAEDIFDDNTFRWAAMVRKLFWYYDCGQAKNSTLGSYYFSESQWVVDRKIKNGRFSAFAAKGGNNDEPHNHNDLGHFILHNNGENIFIDIGAPEYVKDYFRDETRYSFLAAASLGHSVPEINHHQQGYGKKCYAEVVKYKSNAPSTLFSLDLTKAYFYDELLKFQRDFIWNSDLLELKIEDSFKFNKKDNEIREAFITAFRPELVSRGKVRIEAANSFLELSYDEQFECSIEDCKLKDHDGKDRIVYRISISIKADEESSYAFRINLYNK